MEDDSEESEEEGEEGAEEARTIAPRTLKTSDGSSSEQEVDSDEAPTAGPIDFKMLKRAQDLMERYGVELTPELRKRVSVSHGVPLVLPFFCPSRCRRAS